MTEANKPKCEKRRNAADEWICDRCESLWTDLLAETGWRPAECREREASAA